MVGNFDFKNVAAAKEIVLEFSSYVTFESFITVIITVIILIQLRNLLFTPYNRVKNLTDIGYGYLKDESKRRGMKLQDLANEVKKRRKIGMVPPIYPNGWFAIVESSEIPKETVQPVSALGENFAVFRNRKGESFVLDAYCPHLGADLSAGGRIFGDCLACPFHGWQFDGKSGQCSRIPYSESVPSFAKVKKWESKEQNGWIYVWYHAENEPSLWNLPLIAEVESGNWVYRGRVEHITSCHIQEVSENGADIAHLTYLHKPIVTAGSDLRKYWTLKWKFMQHVFKGEWNEGKTPNEHTAIFNFSHSVYLFGKFINLPLSNMTAVVTQYGPGTAHVVCKFKLGPAVFIQTSTPIGPLEIRVVHRFYTASYMPVWYSKILLWSEAIMVERDLMVWNNKRFEAKPLLVKEDRLIARHRRWYLQFYSENSPKLAFSKNSCDW